MLVGVPKEIKVGEQRIALTPAGARAFSDAGHRVLVEVGAGAGSSFRDEEFAAAGAELVDVGELWRQAELILKVKEPLPEEVVRIRDSQTLFTYLHLAAVPDLVRGLVARNAIAIAYETVERADGSLPLLTPMSEVAGRLAVQEGAHYLGRAYGGRGILLSGVPGVPHGNVAILGAGTVGLNAAKGALGLGADGWAPSASVCAPWGSPRLVARVVGRSRRGGGSRRAGRRSRAAPGRPCGRGPSGPGVRRGCWRGCAPAGLGPPRDGVCRA